MNDLDMVRRVVNAETEKTMSSTTPPYTPAQVLEAGRRAEAAGRPDFAIQFYRHLTDHHAGSAEGKEASESLGRLTGAGKGSVTNSLPPIEPKPADGVADAQLTPDGGAPRQSTALARLSYRPEPVPPPPGAVQPAPAPSAAEHGLARVLARAVAVFGIVLIFAGIALPLVFLIGLDMTPLFGGAGSLPFALAIGGVAVALGLAMALAGQVAIAVLDVLRKK